MVSFCTSMKYKSESGMSLDNLNWGVNVYNEIFMGNEPENNGYNN